MAKKKTITVQGQNVTITKVDDHDYISLTDMVRGHKRPDELIRNWLRTRNTLNFLGAWERLYNPDFKPVEFDGLMRYAGDNSFTMSVKEWKETTNGIGIFAKRGKNGGTYAHRDIAFKFGASISPSFELLLIREFQRLKTEEYNRQKREWNYQRFLAKVNYKLHTDTIREIIIPRIQQKQKQTPDWIIYAEEADLLNMAVFGMTAKQWREENPELASEGNIRDHAELIELNILANIESMNAILIERGMNKEDRFQVLAEASVSQYKRLALHYSLTQIEER